MDRDTFHQTRLLKAPSSLALNTSRDGAATTSLGYLCQHLTTLRVKNFFFLSKLNLLSLSLNPLPLVLSLQALIKGPSSAFLKTLFRYWKGCYKVSPESSLVQAEQTQVSQPLLIGEVFHPSVHFCGLLWTCSNRSMSFLC